MLKILWKRGEIAPQEQFLLLFTIISYLILDFYVNTRIGFSLRDKRLFEITEVEITRVDCILFLFKDLWQYQCKSAHFLKNYCSFLRQQKLDYLAFIVRLTHFKYILILILEKKFHVSSVTLTYFMKRGTWNFRSLKIGPISDVTNILNFCLISML